MANKAKNPASVDPLAQVSERVRSSSNILIALSKDPSIDELTAALSLALIFDKYGKHATAIFSGKTPNIISFLQPENTFETDTNSLQDFIIALDKEKADHIRYKIDGDFVKVFITPYKTTLGESDLEFSHGDFNVDLVIALNVKSEGELDSALIEYGRIKHDASSINISPAAPGNFGDIEWGDPSASSVSEMVYRLAIDIQDPESPLIDENVATAILTGIIASTNRFSNERTTPDTLAAASNLMAMGANQQLIAKNIPVDILTAPQTEESVDDTGDDKEKATTEDVSSSTDAVAEPIAEPVVEPLVEPVEEKPADPTNFSIAHQSKENKTPEAKPAESASKPASEPIIEVSMPVEEKPDKEAQKVEESQKVEEAQKADNVEPEKKDARAEAERIVAKAEQKLADEQAKAAEEKERKKKEQEAREKAEAERNQAAKDAVLAKVNAERESAAQAPVAPPADAMTPPQPPKDFGNNGGAKKEIKPLSESKPAPVEAPIIEEPTVVPNAIPAEGILPPPPAPFNASVMPPAMPSSPAPAPVVENSAPSLDNPIVEPNTAPIAPTAEAKPVEPPVAPASAEPAVKIPTANEIAAEYEAKKAAQNSTPAAAPAPAPASSEPTVKIPTANEIAAEYQAKKAAQQAAAPAPVMPAPTMPSPESVANAINISANAPAQTASAATTPVTTAPAAPTLAPRPAAAPASPVATQAPAPAPAAAPAANPINDPGAFHIPGM